MPHFQSKVESILEDNKENIDMNVNFSCPVCRVNLAYIAQPGTSETNLGNIRAHLESTCYPSLRQYVKNEVKPFERKPGNRKK